MQTFFSYANQSTRAHCWMFLPPRQQTTVEEQSRIMQLEEELRLRRAEIEDLQAQLRGFGMASQQPNDSNAVSGPDTQADALMVRDQLASAGGEHFKDSSEKYETALAARQQEVEALKAVVNNKNQEMTELKQKVQQATKENMEMMDTWKVFCFLPLHPTPITFYKAGLCCTFRRMADGFRTSRCPLMAGCSFKSSLCDQI